MQLTELESNGLKRKYQIVVESAAINAQTENELKAAGERVKIPGFRPGYIPMKVLQQRYGKAVQSDVIKNVVNQSTMDAIREKNLRPALTPQIIIEQYNDGGDLTFTMTLEIFPEVPEVAYEKINLERQVFEVDDAEVDDAMNRILERSYDLQDAKEGTKAKLGQIVTIDFKGMIDGKPFNGGTANDFRLELGSKQFIDNFEEQLVGTKVDDDKIVTVTFPKDYHNAEFAGKEASFAVKVKAIADKVIPEASDEFAKERGFSDLRAMREAARDQIIKEYDRVVRNRLKKQLFDTLESEYEFPLPEGMVEMEFGAIWQRLEEAKKIGGDPSLEGKSDDELKGEYRAIAERRVKLGIMLAEIGKRANVQISREEMSRAVMAQAQNFPGQEKQVIEFYRNNPDRVEDLRGPILEEKSVDFILNKVSFSDTKVTIEELLKENEEEGVIKKKPAKGKKKAAKE